MSTNNNSPSSPSPEERKRMVDDALRDLRKKNEVTVTPTQELVNRAKVIHKKTLKLLRDVKKADELNGGEYNKTAMGLLALKIYLDEFRTWSKDELLHLNAVWHSEVLIENIR